MNAARHPFPRVLQVTFSKAEPAAEYAKVAEGTWELGKEPALHGEQIPLEVITGIEVEVRAQDARKGTVFHDRTDVRYAMDYMENAP